MVSINNDIISMNRGDSFRMPVLINVSDKTSPIYYNITESDTIYFALEEYNQEFENALIRKVFDIEDTENNILYITLNSGETIFLLPGEYYYEIKLKHEYYDGFGRKQEFIDTIVPRKKFIILE